MGQIDDKRNPERLPAPLPAPPVDETVQLPDETVQAPEAPVVEVEIKSIAEDEITVSVAAGELTLVPDKPYKVSQAFAEQAQVLPNVERV